MENNINKSLQKIKEKLKNLNETQFKKIVNLLTTIYKNYGTPNAPLNDKLRTEIKETLKINNNDLFTLEIYFYKKLNIELENKNKEINNND